MSTAPIYSKAKPGPWMQEEVDHACCVAPAAAKRMRILWTRWQESKATPAEVMALIELVDKHNS